MLLASPAQNRKDLLILSGGTAALTTCVLYENTLYNDGGTVTLIKTRIPVTPNAPEPLSYLLN